MKIKFKMPNAKFLVMLLLGTMLLSSCLDLGTDSSHDTEIDKEILSPDGKKVATFYIISGGGAAGFVNTRLQIRDKNKPFKENDSYVFDMSHADEHDFKWKDNRHLIVMYPSDASVSRSLPSQAGIKISYVAKPPLPEK